MNTLKYIFQTAMQMLSMALIIGVSGWIGWQGKTSLVARDSSLETIPSVEKQIRFLESKGFDCGIPKDKAGPKFCDALNRWQYDQCAAKYFKPQIAQITQKPEAGK